MDETPRFHMPLMVPGQGQKEITHNEALLLLDAAIGSIVERRDLGTPPTDAIEGQCWLVSPEAESAWQGRSDQLAVWSAGGWRFLVLPEGSTVFVKIEQRRLRRLAGAWVDDGPVGLPAASVARPAGGLVVDVEARATIDMLIERMGSLGLLSA
jgi:hypothetical protein